MTDQKPDPAEMESALKVISTWASVPGALDARHVRNLCDKALRRRPLDQVHQMLQDEARCGHGGSQQITHAETINAELATPGAVAAGAGAVVTVQVAAGSKVSYVGWSSSESKEPKPCA
jgi:hypothetical protein